MTALPQKRITLLQKWQDTIFNAMCEQATPEQWGKWLRAPLEHAAAQGNTDLVKDLLATGANGKAGWKGCFGRSLLFAAVQGGKHEVVSTLLNSGAQPDVNIPIGTQQWSPLHHAACGGHDTIAKLLLVAGAEVDYVDRDGWTPLHLAVHFGHYQVVLDLLASGATNLRTKKGNAPIHTAAKLGRGRTISLLLLKGAEANTRNARGHPPLHLAVEDGHLAATKALLAGGADMSMRDGDGWSVLDNAAARGHVSVVKTLLQHGADANSRRVNGGTALHLAAQENCTAAINLLMEAGADVEASRIDGWTPLYAACRRAYPEAVNLLLRWGAHETVVDNIGNSADEVVGLGVKVNDRHVRAKDVERVLQLLARAPADRTWRRRGFLVLCRSFPAKARLGLPGYVAAGGDMEKKDIISDHASDERDEAPPNSVANVAADAVGGGEAETNVKGARADASGNVCTVEARVVGLDQDCLFRTILSYL